MTPPPHQTSDQFADLLTAPEAATADARAHLLSCAACAQEAANLRESLALFRHCSTSLADREFAQLPQPSFPVFSPQRTFSHSLVLASAAALLVAAILPLQFRSRYSADANQASQTLASAASPQRSTEADSDEALLEDIDRQLSASVPAPMQALADPNGNIGVGPLQNSQPELSAEDSLRHDF